MVVVFNSRCGHRLQLLLLLHLAVWSTEEEGTNNEIETGSGGGNQTEGGQPHFLHDRLTLNVSVQLGSTVQLHCKIQGIKDQSVSWYRKDGTEIQLITFGFQTYHNDERFALTFVQPEDWQLRIRYVQRRDEGTYQCQVSTHPPLILTIHLQIVEASMQILDERGVEVAEKFYQEGSTMELQCRVSDVPSATALHIAWYHYDHRLNYDDARGGVSLKTELRGSIAKSWLRVSKAVKKDSGTYYCNVTNLASSNVTIHVVTDDYPAAIQGVSRLRCCWWCSLVLPAVVTAAALTSVCCTPHR